MLCGNAETVGLLTATLSCWPGRAGRPFTVASGHAPLEPHLRWARSGQFPDLPGR